MQLQTRWEGSVHPPYAAHSPRAFHAIWCFMLKNRSVPADIVLPHITYQNVAEAMAWLTTAFGFSEHFRYGESGGRVQGAQMRLGNAWIMVNSARPGSASPAQIGHSTQSLTVFVEDVNAHFERAKSAGAKVVENLHETEYGERQYGVEDLEGHRWLFARHARNVSPEEWGATIAGPVLARFRGPNQALDFNEVEGHTEWIWPLRSFEVQADPGAVTGAQASIYSQAKVGLDLPLLDGLYAMVPNADAGDLAKVQTVVRSQLMTLVDGLGATGGPLVSHIDKLFELLLGPGGLTNPEDLPELCSLGLLRHLFGLERSHVNSVEDEQNLTNYIILTDYVIGLNQRWNDLRGFFIPRDRAHPR